MFYAYYLVETKETGIVDSWDKCSSIVNNKNAKFKKFKTEKLAQEWIDSGFKSDDNKNLIKNAIYFDAGTGRGIGVEVRVTDVNKNSILNKVMPNNLINEWGNYLVRSDRTNNFGELTGAYLALKYALKYDVKDICGDSKLVIDYWLNLRYNPENINNDTIDLIHKTNKLYELFKSNGGRIHKIPGDINPADLGFHK